jgi:broad-specificity NMP kinase
MSKDLWEQHTSARGTLRLQGHLNARDRIFNLVQDTSESYLIYIYGSGGIGKTRLVKDILEYPPQQTNLLVAVNLIDLYHTRNHSLAGLVNAFLDVIPGFREYFREQLAANERWEKTARLEQEGLPLAEIVSLRRELTEFFLSSLNQFKGQQRLVLAFDTAEKLLLADQPIQQTLGIGDHIMPILEWLLNELLPRVENAVILLAGRPERENRLLQRLEQIKQKKLVQIELTGLSEEEAINYIDAIADAAQQDSDEKTAEWIRRITIDQRKSIYENLSEYDDNNNRLGVRPIQLSLVIDHYVVSGTPPKEILELAPEGNTDPIKRKSFEENLIAAFQDSKRPVNKILSLMALMPKGMDAGFL